MKILGVIPARYSSTRFPGKPLALIAGKPMIQHVYRRCLKAKRLDMIVVATDDPRIFKCVKDFGGYAEMTSSKHRSGSDRIAEVIIKPEYRKYDIIINIQGDEPLIDPKAIDLLAASMIGSRAQRMATLSTGFSSSREIESPNTVKIVVDRNGNALYFSRSSIPFLRDRKRPKGKVFMKHIGMYAYRRDFLLEFVKWPEGRLESLEKLEQLRALENGASIRVLCSKYPGLAVDVPADIAKAEKAIKGRAE